MCVHVRGGSSGAASCCAIADGKARVASGAGRAFERTLHDAMMIMRPSGNECARVHALNVARKHDDRLGWGAEDEEQGTRRAVNGGDFIMSYKRGYIRFG